jgi:hypothetical protein
MHRRTPMRTPLAVFILFLFVSVANAQIDPGMQAAQQAAQTMDAMQQAMQANQQAMEASQRAAMDSMNLANQSVQPTYVRVATPKFSLKPGKLSAPASVRITDSTRGAIIYYTTDGWTPTFASQRYLGPIPIDSTTTLQAVAIVPAFARSFVATAKYTLPTSPSTPIADNSPSSVPVLTAGKILLPQGTPVRLVFDSDVTSRTASVGDQIPLKLADDISFHGVLVAKKGAPASAIVIQVDKTGAGGLPGLLSFQVQSLNLNGVSVKLAGTAAREGEPKPPNAAVLIPVAGPFFIFKHGTDAFISRGTPYTAFLSADTSVVPQV